MTEKKTPTCLSAILDGLSPIGTSIPPQSDAEKTFGEKKKLFVHMYYLISLQTALVKFHHLVTEGASISLTESYR